MRGCRGQESPLPGPPPSQERQPLGSGQYFLSACPVPDLVLAQGDSS